MAYPEGCRNGKLQYLCNVCPDKQVQACDDNHRIEQAKKKAHGGKTNAEIHAEDNFRIMSKKYQSGNTFPEIPEGEGVANV